MRVNKLVYICFHASANYDDFSCKSLTYTGSIRIIIKSSKPNKTIIERSYHRVFFITVIAVLYYRENNSAIITYCIIE